MLLLQPVKKVSLGLVEIITSVQRRRRWTPGEKKTIEEETEQPGMSISAIARKYWLHPNQLFTWRRLMHEGALSAVGAGEAVVPISEAKELRFRIRELERLPVRIARKKKLISRVPLLEKDDIR